MLPTVSSVGSSSAGFTGIFYKVPRRAASAEYAQGTQGTVFQGGGGRSFEAFKQTGDFEKVQREYAQQAERLKQFSHQNNPHNAKFIAEQIDHFLQKFKDGSFLGYEEEIYGQGKLLFDRFCEQIADADIPLDQRLTGLGNLAQRLRMCGFGIIGELQQAVFDLNLSGEGLHQQALDSHSKLVDATLQDFVQNQRARNLVHLEIHYVSELKRRLGFPGAEQLPKDRLVMNAVLIDKLLEGARKAVNTETGPCQVALLTAETCLQSLGRILSNPFTMEQLQTAVDQLEIQFGPIPFNHVAQYDKATNQYSLVTCPNLLARSFLESLTQSGYCSEQIPVRILSWTIADQTSRTISCQGDAIPYVEVSMGRARELYNVSIEDLTQLYREARDNPIHVKLPNAKTLRALDLSAIDAAEPGQLAEFDYDWMRGDSVVLNSLISKCQPTQFKSWVNRLTPDQRLNLGDGFGYITEANINPLSKLLDAVGPEEAGRIFESLEINGQISTAFSKMNSNLLRELFSLLDRTNGEYRKNVCMQNAVIFSDQLRNGINVKGIEEYLNFLHQARADGVLNSADIVKILEKKRKDGATNFVYMLTSGHSEILKAVLDALPGLELNPEEILRLLTAKTPVATGFYLACQNDCAAALDVYLDALVKLNISPDQIHDILGTKATNGATGIHYVCLSGHAKTLEVIFKGLTKLKLPSALVYDLLKANRTDGTHVSTGLYEALVRGHTATVQVFMQSFHSLELTENEICDLVNAIRSDGFKGRDVAEAFGHSDTVTIFDNILKTIELSPTQVDLILAPGPAVLRKAVAPKFLPSRGL